MSALHLSDLLVDDRTMASFIEEAVADVIAAARDDAERLAEAGNHSPVCRAVQVNGIVDAPDECDCGWGRALRAHMDLLATEGCVLVSDQERDLAWCGGRE